LARATIVARDLCSTRGTVANPDFMEEAIHKIAKVGEKNVKSIIVKKGEELRDMGMGLIYNVGKAAVSEP